MSVTRLKTEKETPKEIPGQTKPQPSLYLVKGLTPSIIQLDWNKYLPLKLSNEITVVLASYAEATQFSVLHFNEIYGNKENSPFLTKDSSSSRSHYYEQVGDFFLFKKAGETIGMFSGNLIDWSTYYIRNISIVPEHQGKGIYQEFLEILIPILTSYSIRRIEISIAPNNHPNIHIHNKLRFVVTSMQMSERWGFLLQFTKFLDEKNSKVFESQFCSGTYKTLKK